MTIWIDTDGGVDDALAIAAATRMVAAGDLVCSTVFGNVSARQAACNVQKLLRLLEVSAPVLVGAERASDGFVQYATDVHGADGLGNNVGAVAADMSFAPLARELPGISQRLKGESDPIRILGLGPATNVPAIAKAVGPERIGGITLMTGVIFDRGNITEHAEFNLYNDPAALLQTLDLGLPVTIVPLDICRKIIFNRADLQGLAAFGAAQEMLTRAHQFYMAGYRETEGVDGCFPHETVALLSMIYPSRFEFCNIPFDLEVTGERRGKMRFHLTGKHQARFCLGGDLAWVRRLTCAWSFPAAAPFHRTPVIAPEPAVGPRVEPTIAVR
jgi:inosine-uridine nucleoside N-ribohydrolase